ncbi:hypothetical protein [Runella slithyformis]|uniref:Uncharacterized protein n=1 Tax=Runella slithyformis (strain ATCC 29530 / DSM 19594 / LMG 11500 / NCIMB 11436 / LSU 4) TaxID=761193 RepID=A0A7U3ZGG2_RUNSL|nr:hypothetical protein [Runella slithyformis]AEI46771.1 hypothetical protein Runsl_0319 [Runella slithyformis DSM 19594]
MSNLDGKFRAKDLNGLGLSKENYTTGEKALVADLLKYNEESYSEIEGFYMGANSPVVNSGSKYIVIPASAGEDILVSSSINGSAIRLARYFNNAGVQIGTSTQIGIDGVTTNLVDVPLVIPEGTIRAYISCTLSGKITVKRKLGEAKFQGVQPAPVTKNGWYMGKNGVIVASATRKITSFSVIPGEKIRITTHISGDPLAAVTFLDRLNNVVSFENVGTNGLITYITAQVYTVPKNAAICFVNFTDIVVIEKEIINSALDMQGQHFLWLGTSIPQGGQYPQRSAAKLGAYGINLAVGSSMMRISKADGTINGLAWQNVAYSLCHTIAEKNDLITNWATYRPLFGNAAQAPTTLSVSDQAFFLSCSYENRLLPYLDGRMPMPDKFFIDHGHNDNLSSDSDTQFTTIPATRNDRRFFLGAANFIIDLILQYNPRARIAIIGHYENARKTRVSTAQIALADYWDFPIFRLWERLGWTQQIVPGTQPLWATAPYNSFTAGANTSTDMTMTRLWMPDDLHPHSDTSGRTQDLITNNVAEFARGFY